jgi:hypothetical protein
MNLEVSTVTQCPSYFDRTSMQCYPGTNKGKITRMFFHIHILPSLCQMYTGCLKIRDFQIQSVVGDHFSSPNVEIKKNSGLPPQRYIDLKVHSLKCVFFKYSLKSSVFIVIYGVDDCGK